MSFASLALLPKVSHNTGESRITALCNFKYCNCEPEISILITSFESQDMILFCEYKARKERCSFRRCHGWGEQTGGCLLQGCDTRTRRSAEKNPSFSKCNLALTSPRSCWTPTHEKVGFIGADMLHLQSRFEAIEAGPKLSAPYSWMFWLSYFFNVCFFFTFFGKLVIYLTDLCSWRGRLQPDCWRCLAL